MRLPSLEAGRRLVNQGLLRVEAGDLFTDGTPRPTIENAARIELAAAASCGAARISGDALLRNTGAIKGTGELGLTLDNDGSVTGALAVESNSDTVRSVPPHETRTEPQRRPPRFRPLGGRRARRDRPRPVAGRRDLLERGRASRGGARSCWSATDVSAAATSACGRYPSNVWPSTPWW